MALSPVSSVALGLVLVFVVYRFLIHPAFLSPLARIPAAHPSAHISSLWILWRRHQFTENAAIYNAHAKLGPFVRLGPREVSVNCVDGGLRTIYAGGYEKDVWYSNLFDNYGDIPNMFSTTNSKPHSSRKRMLSHVYSKSYLQSSKTMHAISGIMLYQRLFPALQAAKAAVVDVHFMFNCLTMDFITAYQFGCANSSNFMQDHKSAKWWLALYQSRKKFTFWAQEMPDFSRLMSVIGINLTPSFVAPANKEIEEWCMRMLQGAAASSSSPEATRLPQDESVVYTQLDTALTREADKPTSSYMPLASRPVPQPLLIASEFLDNLAAGHETSAITLTYLFHELSSRPLLQQRLRQELVDNQALVDAADAGRGQNLPSAKNIDNLPLLHAVLMETLRLHAAIPGPQPRSTPANASLGPYHNLPAETRVSASAYCLHRIPAVFTDPLSWKPGRWLDADVSAGVEGNHDCASGKEQLAEMHRHFWAFGSGGRMCIGSNFAMQEMKLIVCAIVSNWRVECVDDTGIEQEDAYTAQPTGQKLLVRFIEWQNGA